MADPAPPHDDEEADEADCLTKEEVAAGLVLVLDRGVRGFHSVGGGGAEAECR